MSEKMTDQLEKLDVGSSLLRGKTAIVTGGSRGIGATIAKVLAAHGAQVVINYRSRAEHANSVVEEIKDAGGSAYAVSADVSNSSDVRDFIGEVKSRFDKIDILVNNAGITRDRTFRNLSEDEWTDVIDVNLNSAFLTTSAVIQHMLDQEFGRIINISSVIGKTGGFGQTNYAASKAGLIGFTKSLALETATSGITVNAILPGFIDTEMVQQVPENVLDNIISTIPMRRLGKTNEIADAVLFLVQADYMTGQSLHVNGGLFM